MKRAALNLILVVTSLMIAVLGAELVLHWLIPRPGPHEVKLFYEHDDLLGWHLIPNEEGLLDDIEYSVHKKINSKCLRGPEWPYEKPSDNTYRILCIGDSYCEGYSVDLEDLFEVQLERMLNAGSEGTTFEVINGGTGGYSTDQELLFFETEGYKYHPDLVVLLVYYNDIAVNTQSDYWDTPKPMFVLKGNGELNLTNVPVPKPGVRTRSLWEWLDSNSRIYGFLADAISRIWGSCFGDPDELPPMPPSYKEYIVFQRFPSRENLEAWRLMKALLNRLNTKVESAGAELLVFCIPFKGSVYRDEFEGLVRHWRVPRELCDPDRFRRDLAEACAESSIQMIDPQERFEREAAILGDEGRRLYFPNDDHWTPEGNDLVAEILYDYINGRHANRVREQGD
ncbi:MAG: hypothetical protein JW941_03260 [Candidatus Coatesbacteria bacterium]|nr:hypothetical protein [Candidatus Coatesbacteria bacterium]